ncbi:hypothetical protein [Asanoa siamensis]|uniref:Uncharacterized protein n=1 Tax=Asanoa siamensis TaxID=926357 RepID=A0ABQ4CK37_9ACTN|nr:hypothetical protein [Asanoa siamensis]GIF71657.1 hypothetical protein Asi02nite_11750 [Asanoa siamensis]
MVVPGVVDAARGVPSLRHGAVTAVRLRAEPADLRRRIAARHRPLDRLDPVLREAADARLRAANLAALWSTFHARGARRTVVVGHVVDVPAYRAAAEAEALERAGLGDHRVDTGGRPVPEIVDEILRRWPTGPGPGSPAPG